ncbi:MAG: YtxH domain-containing protein [Armatimonadetes bacterium]|nr:YtxH domain-containing protein [Armatimonadota bacterium]
MSNDEERSILLSVLAGIGLGAIIGAAAGLLFAPKAGTETREGIKKAAEDLRDRAEGVIGELSTSVDELVQKTRGVIDTTKAKVQDAIETGKQAMAEKRQELEKQAEEGTGA